MWPMLRKVSDEENSRPGFFIGMIGGTWLTTIKLRKKTPLLAGVGWAEENQKGNMILKSPSP